jgi:hypothetical protein
VSAIERVGQTDLSGVESSRVESGLKGCMGFNTDQPRRRQGSYFHESWAGGAVHSS